MLKKNIIFLCFLPCLVLQAQEADKPSVRLSGQVKSDFSYDTRQNFSPREGHFMLWPKDVQLDSTGVDLNDHGNLNFLAIQSRLGVHFTAPDAMGAKISGLIEGDFFGQANANINLLRLRHAYVQLKWQNSELLFGQYWHPTLVLDCYPGTVSFNTGTPFQPFSRNPQARFTYHAGNLRFIAAAVTQRDYTTPAPGKPITFNSDALRNSGIPEVQVQAQFKSSNEETGNELVAGLGGGFKQVVPLIVTAKGYKTDASVNSFSGIGYLKMKNRLITAKFEGVYGQNTYDVMGISSYAIKSVVDVDKDIVEYTPMANYSVWTDIHNNGKVQFGVFAGFMKNLGSKEEILTNRWLDDRSNIDYLYRISPRVVYPLGKARTAFEIEHTAAAFGTVTNKGTVADSREVANTRFLFSIWYSF
jgi:hypothetical protein